MTIFARSNVPFTGSVMRNQIVRFLGKAALPLVCGLVFLFLLAPTIIVIPVSFSGSEYVTFPPTSWSLRWYAAYFQDPEWIAATAFSLKIAALTTIASVILGTMGALALVRAHVPFAGAIKAIVLAPMIVPHIVIAVAMYLVYSQWNIAGTLPGFVLAHTVICVPFVVINVSAGLQKLDASLEMAAGSLGANRLRAFWHITLPLLGPSMITAAAFAFITSLDEAIISYFLSGSVDKTLTRKMFEDIDFDLTPIIAVVSTLIVILSVAVMGSIELLRARVSRRAAK